MQFSFHLQSLLAHQTKMSVLNCFVRLCVILVSVCVQNTLSDGYVCSQSGVGPQDMMMSNGRMNPNYMWYKRGGRVYVPVVMDKAYRTKERNTILNGLMEIERKTCVEFYIFNNTAKLKNYDYVYITRSKRGCWSYVGRVGGGAQDLSLPPGCISHRTSIHEMMHALGFPHEHVRSDRDEFVHILWGNIQPGRERNFERKLGMLPTNYGPYDYESIMHYDTKAFTFNGLETLRPLRSAPNLGRGRKMSYWDAHKINSMYKCGSHRGSGSSSRYRSPKYANSFPQFDDSQSHEDPEHDDVMTHDESESPTGSEYDSDDHNHSYNFNYLY